MKILVQVRLVVPAVSMMLLIMTGCGLRIASRPVLSRPERIALLSLYEWERQTGIAITTEARNLVADEFVEADSAISFAIVEKQLDETQALRFRKALVKLYLMELLNEENRRSFLKPASFLFVQSPAPIITSAAVQKFSVGNFLDWLRQEWCIFWGLLLNPDVGYLDVPVPSGGARVRIQAADKSLEFGVPPPLSLVFPVGDYTITMQRYHPDEVCSGRVEVEKNQSQTFRCTFHPTGSPRAGMIRPSTLSMLGL